MAFTVLCLCVTPCSLHFGSMKVFKERIVVGWEGVRGEGVRG